MKKLVIFFAILFLSGLANAGTKCFNFSVNKNDIGLVLSVLDRNNVEFRTNRARGLNVDDLFKVSVRVSDVLSNAREEAQKVVSFLEGLKKHKAIPSYNYYGSIDPCVLGWNKDSGMFRLN